MNIIQIDNYQIELNEDGFMKSPDMWNEEIATRLAEESNIKPLTDNHWLVIGFLRNYYLKHGISPKIKKLCNDTGFSLREIYDLFPMGPAKGATRIAGLPEPASCA